MTAVKAALLSNISCYAIFLLTCLKDELLAKESLIALTWSLASLSAAQQLDKLDIDNKI